MNTAETANSPSHETDPAPRAADTPATADNQAPATQSGDSPASPPDAPADDRSALLEIAQRVVQDGKPKTPPQGEDAPAAPDGTQDAKPPAAPDPTLDADPTEDELAKLVPRTKARIEKLLSQRNDARTEAEGMKPSAEKWAQMDRYLTQHDLAAEDVNLLLGVGAALRRGDFKAFLDGVSPYVQLANQALGLDLPADLQGKVDGGEMTVEAARELSVARVQNARLQGRVDAANQQERTNTQQAEQARVSRAVSDSVVSWEVAVKGRDPDYAIKAPAVERYARALMAETGNPQTPEAAVALAQRAYEEVNRQFAAMRPAPVPTRPQPSGVRALNGAHHAQAGSIEEAAMQGLERYRAGRSG